VVVTQVVRDLVRGKGFRFEDLGAVTLKGFPEPERLFVVGEGD
jgi:class 3 adenylate cyclase